MSNYSNLNKTLFQEIYRNLLEEVNLYESLAETAQNKQKAIVDNNIDDLQSCTGMEQSFIKKGQMLTRLRSEKMAGSYVDKNRSNHSLAHFIRSNRLDTDQEWLGLANRLENAVSSIKRLNTENRILLKTSLSFVQGLINLYYPKKEKPNNTYTREGKEAAEKAHVVDCGV